MQYKTIIHGLIQQRPEFEAKLAASRTTLKALDRYAKLLKNSHEAWIEELRARRPNSEDSQLASEAIEIAVKEIGAIMPSGSEPDETEALSLVEAMAFLRTRAPQN